MTDANNPAAGTFAETGFCRRVALPVGIPDWLLETCEFGLPPDLRKSGVLNRLYETSVSDMSVRRDTGRRIDCGSGRLRG